MTVEAKIRALLERAVPGPAMQEPRTPQGSSVIDQHGQDDIEDLGMARAGQAAAAHASPTGLPVGHTLEDGEVEVQLQGSSDPESPDEEDLAADDDLDLGCTASNNANRANPYPVGNDGQGETDVQVQGSSDETTPGQPTRKDAYANLNRALESAQIPDSARQELSEAFENAVTNRVEEEINKVGKKIVEMAESMATAKVEQLYENINEYLNYAVTSWMNENQVAIDLGLKTKMAESFIAGLKNLFEEHSIDIPEDQETPLQLAVETIDQMESKLNDVVQENVSLTNENLTLKRQQIVERVSRNMAVTDAEKFNKLVEELEFNSPKEFEDNLVSLRKRYLENKNSGKQVVKEEIKESVQNDEFVNSAVRALSKTVKIFAPA